MGHLILVRHGESRWNIDNKFTGWVDVPLTEVGVHEALIAAEKLGRVCYGMEIDPRYCDVIKKRYENYANS